MKEGILDINNTKQLNNLDNLLKENSIEDKNVINIKNNIKDFDEAKKKIKSNYINKVNDIFDEKIEEQTLSSDMFFEYTLFSTAGFSILCLFILLIVTSFIEPTVDPKDTVFLLGCGIVMCFFFIFPFLSLPLYKFIPKKLITNLKNVNKLNKTKENIIDNIEYFLPLKKSRLEFITKNNSDLRNYVINHSKTCYSQYSIDKILGNGCALDKYLDSDILELFDLKYSSSLGLNDLNTSIFNKTLLLEQSNLSPLDDKDVTMREFKVEYAIDFGPEKSIIVTHTHEDRAEFESYINSFVENNYNRKCNILSIEEI